MWGFASRAVAGSLRQEKVFPKLVQLNSDCSDDEASSCASKDDGFECPICCESFNMVENVPYVLWCGHTLCKNCVIGLQWAIVKFSTLHVQLPLFISCPWCNLLSLRFIYKGELKFPRKNFFLLWMLESINGDQVRRPCSSSGDHEHPCTPSTRIRHHHHHLHDFRSFTDGTPRQYPGHSIVLENSSYPERIHLSLRNMLALFVRTTSKFPLVIIFLLIAIYAVPASAAILVLYILITVLFGLPSFLILYFAYPSLNWLLREIIT